MSNVAIRVENLGKMYRIGGPQERYKTFRDAITRSVSAPFRRARDLLRGQAYGAAGLTQEIWALKEVSFEVKHGDVVGIIGRNGAGKSTLLKVLSRITEPTTGYADIYGRVGALLEVGTGFHPELTGRENVYLNGAILGMSRRDIDRKFDEIVSFAGVEKFIDTPVKHYSSGMGLRLGFSVAAHLEPDILVVDEVLAVGDAEFQKKCLGKMSDVAGEGRTVLFVSHNMAAVQSLCSRSILLNRGKIVIDDATECVIDDYLSNDNISEESLLARTDRTGDGKIKVSSIYFTDIHGNQVKSIRSGDYLNVVLNYVSELGEILLSSVMLDLHLTDQLGQRVATLSTRFSQITDQELLSHEGSLVCSIPAVNLTIGSYNFDIWVAFRGVLCDQMRRIGEFEVGESDFFGTGHMPVARKHGNMLIKHQWTSIQELESFGEEHA